MRRASLLLTPLLIIASPLHAAEPNATRLSLDQAVGLALNRDANVDRTLRMTKIARLQVEDARANYRPNASVTVSASQSAAGSTYSDPNVDFRNGIAGNFIGTVSGTVSMPIDISGSIGRQVKAARIGDDIAKLSHEQAKANALIDVQIAYLSALEAQQTAHVDEAVVGSIGNLKEQAAKRLPRIVPFLEVELANALEMLSNSRAAADHAKDALKLELRLPLSLALDLTTPLPDLKDAGLAGTATEASDTFDIQAAKRRVDAAELAVEQARDSRRPSLQVGGYATQTFSGRFIDEAGKTTNRDYGFNIALNVPLLSYDAGRNAHSVQTSKIAAEQAKADLETSSLAQELAVRQAEDALQRARKRLTQLPDANAAATALSSAIDALFKAPPETAPGLLAQVSNARSSWRAAQTAVIDAKTGALIAALRLARVADKPLLLARDQAS